MISSIKKMREHLKSLKIESIKRGFAVDELSNPKYDLPIIVINMSLSDNRTKVLGWIGRYLQIPYKNVAEIYDNDGYEGLQNDGWVFPLGYIDGSEVE